MHTSDLKETKNGRKRASANRDGPNMLEPVIESTGMSEAIPMEQCRLDGTQRIKNVHLLGQVPLWRYCQTDTTSTLQPPDYATAAAAYGSVLSQQCKTRHFIGSTGNA